MLVGYDINNNHSIWGVMYGVRVCSFWPGPDLRMSEAALFFAVNSWENAHSCGFHHEVIVTERFL